MKVYTKLLVSFPSLQSSFVAVRFGHENPTVHCTTSVALYYVNAIWYSFRVYSTYLADTTRCNIHSYLSLAAERYTCIVNTKRTATMALSHNCRKITTLSTLFVNNIQHFINETRYSTRTSTLLKLLLRHIFLTVLTHHAIHWQWSIGTSDSLLVTYGVEQKIHMIDWFALSFTPLVICL